MIVRLPHLGNHFLVHNNSDVTLHPPLFVLLRYFSHILAFNLTYLYMRSYRIFQVIR